MIKVKDKSACCGCVACVQICPKQCISLDEDKEGFLYPTVNRNLCIECGKCEAVCIELHSFEVREPLKVFAAQHFDESVRAASSSGGIFTLLAETIINDGGVVFGARFDSDWSVVHDFTETHEGLQAFRGSKYLQSRIGNTYRQAEKFLKAGRKVLFSGTPCQIAGLKRYLHKDYENLLAVDFVCHGVPSPLVWKKYLEETIARQCEKNSVLLHFNPLISERGSMAGIRKRKIDTICFRNKNLGWKKYSFALTLSEVTTDGEKNTVLLSTIFPENEYMQAFLADFSLRPSCYACPAKGGKSGSDLTIGDFWGIEKIAPEIDDDKGCSLVIVHTDKKVNRLSNNSILSEISLRQDPFKGNPSYYISPYQPVNRAFFFSQFGKNGFCKAWKKTMSTKLQDRILRKIYQLL